MAELNLKQITDKLNHEFTGDTRKLVFWYDDKAEFFELSPYFQLFRNFSRLSWAW